MNKKAVKVLNDAIKDNLTCGVSLGDIFVSQWRKKKTDQGLSPYIEAYVIFNKDGKPFKADVSATLNPKLYHNKAHRERCFKHMIKSLKEYAEEQGFCRK